MSVDEFWRQTLSAPGKWPHIINNKIKNQSKIKQQKYDVIDSKRKSNP